MLESIAYNSTVELHVLLNTTDRVKYAIPAYSHATIVHLPLLVPVVSQALFSINLLPLAYIIVPFNHLLKTEYAFLVHLHVSLVPIAPSV